MFFSSVCHCPACQMGYILAEDKHVCCVACLCPEHTLMALSSSDACPLCTHLPPDEIQQRADAVAALADDNNLAFSHDVYSVKEVLDFFYKAGGPEWDDPPPLLHAPSVVSTSPSPIGGAGAMHRL